MAGRRGRGVRSFAIALGVLLSTSASAQSLEGRGRISIQPGWRWTPNDYFAASAEAKRHALEYASPGGPQLTGTFAYAAGSHIEVAIDLFAGSETLHLADAAAVTSVSYGALVGFRSFWEVGALVPYVGLALGPTLVYTSGGLDPRATERLTTGYSAVGGVTWRVTDSLGITFDLRALLARGLVSGIGGVNAGGAWGGLGLTWYFAPEPERPGSVR